MRMFVYSIAVGVALTSVVAAQESNPVTSALRADQARYEKNLMAAAQAMPADKYSTKPTDQQKSFGELLLHVAGSNNMLCSSISGAKAPEQHKMDASAGKDAIVRALKDSFAFCTASLAKTDDSKLGDEVPFFGGRTVTRAAAILDLSADWGDHYSLVATEMRIAGVTPPTAQRASR